MSKIDEITIRLEHLQHLHAEQRRLLQTLKTVSHRQPVDRTVRFQADEFDALLDATENIGRVIDSILEGLSEETTRILSRIGF